MKAVQVEAVQVKAVQVKAVQAEAGYRKVAVAAATEAVKCVGGDCHSFGLLEPKSKEEVLVVQVEAAQIQPGSPTEYGIQQELHL